MIIAATILAYLLIGFAFVIVWAKFDPHVKECAMEMWWFVLALLYWPLVLAFFIAFGIFYPLKWLFHRITDEV